eukprot:4746053-Prymnesium_polylepis.1
METYEIHMWLRALPGSDGPEYMHLLRFTERDKPPGGKNTLVVPVSGISRDERTIFYFACLVPKFVVSVACVVAGAGAVVRSADDFGLVLNAVAATFILEIDDAVYELLISDASRKMAGAMPAINTHVPSSSGAEPGNDKAELVERPLLITSISAVAWIITICLQRLYWCPHDKGIGNGEGRSGGDSSKAVASQWSFFVVLIIAICGSVWLSLRELRSVKSAKQRLVETYLTILKGKTSFVLDNTRFGATSALQLAEALSLSPHVTELTVKVKTPTAAVKALMKALVGNSTLEHM